MNIFEQAQELLAEKFGLGNSYVAFDKDGRVEDFYFEADNNASISLDVDKLNEATTVEEVLSIAEKAMYAFDAEETFKELWNKEFGERNGFGAFQFIAMLQDDDRQFEEAASDIRSYLRWKKK